MPSSELSFSIILFCAEKESSIATDGNLRPSSRYKPGSNWLNLLLFFVIPKVQHLSCLIFICDQLHHAEKMFRSDCASLIQPDRMTASSANCNQEEDLVVCLGPQMYPRLFKSFFERVCMSELKLRLNKKGEHGSP